MMLLAIHGLDFDDGCTAKGKEKRPPKRWRDPHSSISSMSLSPRAKLLRDAIQGDIQAETSLVNQIADEVTAHARAENLNLQGRQATLVHLACYPYVYQAEAKSQRQSAYQLNVSRASYTRVWLPRIEAIRERWCKCLIDELKDPGACRRRIRLKNGQKDRKN